MNDENIEFTRRIQASMVESAKSTFEEPQLDSLRYLICITVEFYDYLHFGNPELRAIAERDQVSQGVPMPPMGEMELDYCIESIFFGMDSFRKVNNTYKCLVGATKSKIKWDRVSKQSLNDQFLATFKEFTKETIFEIQCRHLLDLFKIQIVFAGIFYD